MTLQELLK